MALSPESSIAEQNAARAAALDEDYDALSRRLARQGIDIGPLVARAMAFSVAVPSWGFGAGGTRFARFPLAGEPRDIDEKLEDGELLFKLVRSTGGISLHFPWDRPDGAVGELLSAVRARGLRVESTNSNTFQDRPDQPLSYRFGSLTHTDPSVRRQAIDHNLECLDFARVLGARAHTVWIGDGSNLAGQQHFRRALDRYLDSMRQIYAALPGECSLLLEYKLYEPSMYSTVVGDWGTSYACARELGPRALTLVDLGHHAPTVNIEQVVARLIQLGKLGGLHFNDSKYGDDDLDAGSVKPFQLFLVFNELVDAEREAVPGFAPSYMLDQSHTSTDPIESLAASAIELGRAYVQASLVDREALAHFQRKNDALMCLQTLKQAFTCDVSPVLAMARARAGGAIDPIATYRASGYRQQKAVQRPASVRSHAGIV